MILIYYPDIDTLDVRFRNGTDGQGMGENVSETVDGPGDLSDSADSKKETHEAEPSGYTLAHYQEGRLEGLTIEQASRRAPVAWGIESLRQEAARVAATTGRIVESVTHDLRRERTSFQTGELGPQSPYTSDESVQAFNRMIDEIEAASATA